MSMAIEVTTHSNGDIRCAIDDLGDFVVANLIDKKTDSRDRIRIFLHTPAEIAAFKALAAALAAQDVPAEEEV